MAFELGVAAPMPRRGPIRRPDDDVSAEHLAERQKKAVQAAVLAITGVVELTNFAVAAAAMAVRAESAAESAAAERAATEQEV